MIKTRCFKPPDQWFELNEVIRGCGTFNRESSLNYVSQARLILKLNKLLPSLAHSLQHSLTHSNTHSIEHSLTLTPTHLSTHSNTLHSNKTMCSSVVYIGFKANLHVISKPKIVIFYHTGVNDSGPL